MFGTRYLLAVMVGLAVGVAAGWLTGRAAEPQHQAAPGRTAHAHTGTPPPGSQQTPPAARQTRPPGIRQVQQQIARCLYQSWTLRQQVGCLRRLLGRQLSAAPWLGFPATVQPYVVPDELSGAG
jgi:hypothetical protein